MSINPSGTGNAVSTNDLRRIRQANDDTAQTNATDQHGAELKAGSGAGVSADEKITAGQSDQVDVTKDPKAKPASGKKDGAKKPAAAAAAASSSARSADSKAAAKDSAKDSASASASNGGSGSPPDGGSTTPPSSGNASPEYTDSEKALLQKLEEMNQQAIDNRRMWRKLYMDWYQDQLAWKEMLETFRQNNDLMWGQVSIDRSVQMAKQAEGVRANL